MLSGIQFIFQRAVTLFDEFFDRTGNPAHPEAQIAGGVPALNHNDSRYTYGRRSMKWIVLDSPGCLFFF